MWRNRGCTCDSRLNNEHKDNSTWERSAMINHRSYHTNEREQRPILSVGATQTMNDKIKSRRKSQSHTRHSTTHTHKHRSRVQTAKGREIRNAPRNSRDAKIFRGRGTIPRQGERRGGLPRPQSWRRIRRQDSGGRHRLSPRGARCCQR